MGLLFVTTEGKVLKRLQNDPPKKPSTGVVISPQKPWAHSALSNNQNMLATGWAKTCQICSANYIDAWIT